MAVADGGRPATITADPPSEQCGITISSFHVRPDGNRLRKLATPLRRRQLEIPVAASYRLLIGCRVRIRAGVTAGQPPSQPAIGPRRLTNGETLS
ncbi:MAG TPA: hypothetical protein VLW50_15215 [Streptosporangiaceae bacterium]|nr:hypothetical protein [Streptosporangiaceae bacterium]